MDKTVIGRLRLRSEWERCHQELTLAIGSSRLRLGGEHCRRELAGGGGERGGEGVSDIKPNNPHLTGA